ncbi:MAG: hypothetical protein JST92_06870 [Deltaproteobacteria bacterium]|nr:hypothetical protein [Deltaproteobacteria bacterium]
MAKRPDDDNPIPASDDEAGATAFVRLDGGKLPPPPTRAPAPAPSGSAPKKGLQVQLPDDEPPPPPKPKPKPAPEAPKGRRGAWWNEESAKIPDEPEAAAAPEDEPPPPELPPDADDEAGATAFLKVEKPAPAPARRKPPPREEPEPAPAPADDGRTQFYKPEEVVLQAEVRQRPAPTAPPEAKIPWKQILIVLGIAFVVTVLSVVIVFRRELFEKRAPTHRAKSVDADDSSGK